MGTTCSMLKEVGWPFIPQEVIPPPRTVDGSLDILIENFRSTCTNFPELQVVGVCDDEASPEFVPPDDLVIASADVQQELLGSTEPSSEAVARLTRGMKLTFDFDVRVGKIKWHLRKLYSDFVKLEREMRRAFGAAAPTTGPRGGFPFRHQPSQEARHTQLRDQLNLFMCACMTVPGALELPALKEFLEWSPASLDPRLEPRLKEGYLSASNVALDSAGACSTNMMQRNWFVLRASCLVIYESSTSEQPKHAILFDEGLQFQVELKPQRLIGECATKPKHGWHYIAIDTKQGQLVVATKSKKEAADWMMALKQVKENSLYCHAKHLGSFAPMRSNAYMRWLVDGRNAYAAMVQAMQSAKEEIFITGWWITPDLPMIRDGIELERIRSERVRNPTTDASEGSDPNLMHALTLKQVLKDRADAGVNIYCQMWREPPMSLPLSSAYQKQVLKALGPTVHVLRHGSLFWTHHEKLVIVDRKLAFIGGIDVAWCRFDTGSHILEDPDHQYFRLGLEYYNPAYSDWVKVEEIWNDRFDRTRYPRMPWHDVHSCVMGPPVVDLCRHFIQRWNFTRITQDKQNKPVMLPYQAVAMREAQTAEIKRDLENGDVGSAARAGEEGPTAPPSAFSASINPKHPCECDEGDNHGASNYCQHDWTQHWSKCDVQVLRSVGEWSAGTETECSIFRAYVHAILHAKHMIYMENQYFLSNLGWTEDELQMYEDASTQSELHHHSSTVSGPAATNGDPRWAAQLSAIVEQATAAGHRAPDGKRSHWNRLQSTLHKQAVEPEDPAQRHWKHAKDLLLTQPNQAHRRQYTELARARASASGPTTSATLRNADIDQPKTVVEHTAATSLSKAVGLWTKPAAASVPRNSQRKPIYRSTPPNRDIMKWKPEESSIAEAIFARLCKAIDGNETFRVVIVLPIHPDGPIRTVRAVQMVLHWQSRTISRGGSSLLERLSARYPDVDLSKYIVFEALRNYGTLSGTAVTEQIYVHSKVMIVDDRVAIIGSANANNRSQYGNRDSECALMISGGETIQTRMAGKPWTATVFAHTFRRNLWEEHLGIGHTCAFASERSANVNSSHFCVTRHASENNAHFPVIPLRQNMPSLRHGSRISRFNHVGMVLRLADSSIVSSNEGRPQVQIDTDDHVGTAATLSADGVPRAASGSGDDGATDGSTEAKRRNAKINFIVTPCVTPTFATSSTSALPSDDDLRYEKFAAQRNAIMEQIAKLEVTCACDAISDPCSPEVYDRIWLAIASHNTEIYAWVFPGSMQNDIKTIDEWQERESLPPRDQHLLQLTVGTLVHWPSKFLENENLDTKATEKEHYLPVKIVQ